MITEQEMKDLEEIRRLLDEAYEHYFATSDGHCKSSEGHIALNFPNFFERKDGAGLEVKSVEIYSYVFGPNRLHFFSSTAEALGAVKKWHEREMQEDYEDDPMAMGWDLDPEHDWLEHEEAW